MAKIDCSALTLRSSDNSLSIVKLASCYFDITIDSDFTSFILHTVDTNSINFTGNGTLSSKVSADVKVSDEDGNGLSILSDGLFCSGGGAVTSVFGRTGAVVAVSGDYTGAQITQDSTHRFATDAEKTLWNAKQDGDADLTAIAALTPANDDVLQRKGGVWTNRTINQLKTDLALTGATITAQRLLGRYAGTNGDTQEISIGSGLELNSTTGVLSATGDGGTCYDTLAVFSANPASTVTGSTSATYLHLNGTTFNTTKASRVLVSPTSGTLKNLFVFASGTQPASGALSFTVQTGSAIGSVADTLLLVTIAANTAAGSGTVYSNTIDTVAVNAGDLIVIKANNAASAASLTANSIGLLLTN